MQRGAPASAQGDGHDANGAANGGNGVVAIELPAGGAGTPGSLLSLEPPAEVTVEFKGISCWVPKLGGPSSPWASLKGLVTGKSDAPQAKEDMRQVLFSVSGSCEPGEVLALMGPSGGGKTTLLSILGGRTPKQTVPEGRVLFNGTRISKRVKRQIGFVLQDDLLYATLTVQETLTFAAMLRLPKHKTRAEKLERVAAVIEALGLSRCKDTIIGDQMRRGVSGGERKRVSVGHELLINPSILLLDEPTSGLDSSAARKLVELLRQLATSGRTVLTTIHQPSSNIYKSLDRVLLLSQGHPIYYGAGAQAATWFDKLGFPCPFGTNIADWILDLASGEVAGKHKTGEAARLHFVACSEQFLESDPRGYEGGHIDAVDLEERASSRQSLEAAAAALALTPAAAGAGTSNGNDEEEKAQHAAGSRAAPGPHDLERGGGGGHGGANGALSDAAAVVRRGGSSKGNMLADRAASGLDRTATGLAAASKGASRWGASYWTQFLTLFIRAVRVRRFETLSRQDLIQFIVVGGVCGMIWWQAGQSDTLYGAQNTQGLLFFEGLFLAFRVLFTSLFTFPQEQKMMLKERASGMYRLSAFYLARTASDIPSDLSIPSLFIVIIYLMGGLRHGGYFFLNWLTVLLTVLVAQSIGLLIGATVMVAKTAQTIAAVIMLTFMLVGGFYVRNIPAWIGWIKWLGFLTYTFSLLLKIEFSGRQLWDCATDANPAYNPSDPWNQPQCSPVPDINEAMQAVVDLNSPAWEAAVLVGFLLLFRVAVYYALRTKTQR